MQILVLLRNGERNVTEICKNLQVAQPTINHHLRILLMGGAVGNRRAGKQVFYRLCDQPGGGGIMRAGMTLDAGSFCVGFTFSRQSSPNA